MSSSSSSSRLRQAGGWSSAEDVLNSIKSPSKKKLDDDDSSSIFFNMSLFPNPLSRSCQSVSVQQPSDKENIKTMPTRQTSKDDSSFTSSTVPRSIPPQRVITKFKGLDGPVSIVQCRNDSFVVSEWRGNSISLLTKEGSRLLTFGRKQLSKKSIIYHRLSGVPTTNAERHGQSFGELHEPTGILITSQNKILVVDSKNHRLQLFTYGGTPLTTVGGTKGETIEFNFPYDVCTDASGRIYVSDTFNHRVLVLTENFLVSHEIGERGSTLGHFEYPLGLAMDREGMLYVCDRDNSRVQKMTCYGRTVTEFKHPSLKYPVKVAVDGSNIVYVSYSYSPHVVMFDGNSGEVLGSFSSQSHSPHSQELMRPRGIMVDETGKVYVCDTSRNEIWLF